MGKKYELVKDSSIECEGNKLYRIRALKDFSVVKKGDLGGYVESEINLDQDDNCWVYDDAEVYGNNAIVYGNAALYDNATVCDNASVSDNAEIHNNAKLYGSAIVYGNAKIYGNSVLSGNVSVFDNARMSGNPEVYGNAKICECATVSGNTLVSDNARVSGKAEVDGNAKVSGNAKISGNAKVFWNATVCDNVIVTDNARVFGNDPVRGTARVSGNTWVAGNTKLPSDTDKVKDTTKFTMSAEMYKEFTQLTSDISLDLQGMLNTVHDNGTRFSALYNWLYNANAPQCIDAQATFINLVTHPDKVVCDKSKKYRIKILGTYIGKATFDYMLTSLVYAADSFTQKEIDEMQKLPYFKGINLDECKEEVK